MRFETNNEFTESINQDNIFFTILNIKKQIFRILKKYIFLFLIFVCFFNISSFSTENKKNSVSEKKTGIKYYPYKEGLKEAKKNKKYIIIYFYSKRCPWCRILEREWEESEKVKEYLTKNFLLIRVDAEVEETPVIKYRIRGVPTIWFLESNGNPIGPVPGYIPVEDFYLLLKYIKSGSYKKMSFSEYQEKYKKEEE
jgi:thioredoxin-related protein